jgi:hypothetical protein
MKKLQFKEWIVEESEIWDTIKDGVANGFKAYVAFMKKKPEEPIKKKMEAQKPKKERKAKHSDADIKKWLLERLTN